MCSLKPLKAMKYALALILVFLPAVLISGKNANEIQIRSQIYDEKRLLERIKEAQKSEQELIQCIIELESRYAIHMRMASDSRYTQLLEREIASLERIIDLLKTQQTDDITGTLGQMIQLLNQKREQFIASRDALLACKKPKTPLRGANGRNKDFLRANQPKNSPSSANPVA